MPLPVFQTGLSRYYNSSEFRRFCQLYQRPHLGPGALAVTAFEKGWRPWAFSALYNHMVVAAWMFIASRVFLENRVAFVPFCGAYADAVATVPFWTLAREEFRSDPNAGTRPLRSEWLYRSTQGLQALRGFSRIFLREKDAPVGACPWGSATIRT